jgi:5-methyltetrahydrofolate--homocysteine methyltransferase
MTCGLGNVSFGLPGRKLLNQAMCLALMAHGMDTFIIDPLDGKIMSLVRAMNALLGHDEYCEIYLDTHRNGQLVI